MARIDSFFRFMHEQGASDLHLSTGNQPMLRIHGELIRVDAPPLESDDLKALVYEIAPETKIKVFEETGDVDFGYEYPGYARYRANFLNQKNGIASVFRLIPSKILTVETHELALNAASTGHTVFGTLHTSSAAKTIDRIIDVFPTNQQNQIRASLAESLKGVVAQNLFRRVDKPGRCAALEILVCDS